MAELLARPPLAGLDLTVGATRLAAADPGRLTWLAPFPGGTAALSAALMEAHGLAFPAPGEVTEAPGVRCLWSGRAQALLAGPDPAPGLVAHGAALDVTEVWATLLLEGPKAGEALARLVPADLRPAALPPGRTLRTLLGHMGAQITATAGGFEILVMRSMSRTAAHEIEAALRGVAARPAG